MSLPPEVRANYVSIIDSILSESDLTLISEKTIRKGIQERVEYDITPQKAAIKEVILERFDLFSPKGGGEPAPLPSVETAHPPSMVNGHHKTQHAAPRARPEPYPRPHDPSHSPATSTLDDDAPAKKKRKTSVEDDAALAARLQAEEERLARPTRGGASRKSATVKKKTPKKKKTSVRVGASDDSDMSGSDSVKPQRNTGFHKPLNLSPALSDLLGGEISLSRPQTTKKIWQHIKANNLQDPSDKRFIICDDKMREVFRQDKVHMFTMTKLLNQNLYNPDE